MMDGPIGPFRIYCDPVPFETTSLIDGVPHRVHCCPPCIHGCIKTYAYPRPEPGPAMYYAIAAEGARLHAQLDELTCSDHA